MLRARVSAVSGSLRSARCRGIWWYASSLSPPRRAHSPPGAWSRSVGTWPCAAASGHDARMANPATVVLVHGAWHGTWCWDAVTRRLDAAGVPNIAVDNPSVTWPSVERAPAGLDEDADNVRRVLDGIDGPVVLVGHSYGGAVITDAGTHDRVQHLVYVTAFTLDDGESVMQNDLQGGEGATELVEALRFDGDAVTLEPEGAIAAFYHDCPE